MIDRFVPYRLKSRLDRQAHDKAVANILSTPPIVPRNDGLVLFSMIGTAVLLPYLVAAKSLWQQLQRGRIVILDDGTLTAQDRATLSVHCGDPEIIPIDTVNRKGFPKGGCWERLLTILDRRTGEYWVQLDSDTVTIGPVPELEQAIATNRSFTMLGGEDGEVGVLPLREFAEQLYPDGATDKHIQSQIESRMDEMRRDLGWKYVRGCAGFAGFAAGGSGRSLAGAFLSEMERLVDAEGIVTWGTEQIASNFVIANEPEPVLLPAWRYLNYWGEPWASNAGFVHFVGTHRYDEGAYAKASRKAIDELRGSRAETGT
jgi:hypothetical protein